MRCVYFLVFLALISCIQKPKPVFTPGYQPPTGSITVMTFNVQNLFDTENDPEKNDETFLPLDRKDQQVKSSCYANNTENTFYLNQCLTENWSERILKMKMKRLTDVVSQVKNGKGPDVLILQEVENVKILDRWRTEYLGKMNYKPAILIEGPDQRGIDVGVLTRLESVGPATLHLIPFKANDNLTPAQIRPTRGILETTLALPDGSLLTVLGLHFPSQSAPTETRKQAVDFINVIRSKLPPDRMVIVGGDFNISSEEDMKKGYISQALHKDWGVSHIMGCKGCSGTTYYPKTQSWSFFDILLVTPGLKPEGQSPWKVIPESIRVENNSIYHTNRYGTPARFSNNRKDGVSDHWPMVMEIMKR
ncbi:endonuclease/exonuclease/phosphatase family protein [bacterium]|nr:endonuclease/exonuclease/phosphatase family protein [bacterium]